MSSLEVTQDQQRHFRGQFLYHCNHHWKGEENGHEVVREQINAEYYHAP